MLLHHDSIEKFPSYATLPVYVDGRIVAGKDAGISVWDHGFLYGDGVFEGIRVYDGGFFALQEHLDRLIDSLKGIGIDPAQVPGSNFATICAQVVAESGLRDAHVRIIVTRGVGKLGLDAVSCERPTVVVMAYPMPPLLGEQAIRLLTSSVRRKGHDSIDSKLKTLNYLDGVLARLQARHAGMDGALLLDSNGFVAEGSGENIFWYRKGVWYTPTCVGALEGITRKVLIDLMKTSGAEVREGQFTLQEVYRAEEVLLCGSGAEVVAVGEVDGRPIGNDLAMPRTREIAETYRKFVRTEHRTSINYTHAEKTVERTSVS